MVKHAFKPQNHSFGGGYPGRWHIKHLFVPDPANEVPEPSLFGYVIVTWGNWHRQDFSSLKESIKKSNGILMASRNTTNLTLVGPIFQKFDLAPSHSQSSRSWMFITEYWRFLLGLIFHTKQTNKTKQNVEFPWIELTVAHDSHAKKRRLRMCAQVVARLLLTMIPVFFRSFRCDACRSPS